MIQVGNIIKIHPIPDALECYNIGRVTSINGNYFFYTPFVFIWDNDIDTEVTTNDFPSLIAAMPGESYFDWSGRIEVLS